MTDVPKVSDNTSNNSIDIFVFSNGQECSPPRKYHICAEDLNLWQSTLNFLARSQYGSLHNNIELFTTEGNKVFTPTELNTGVAYVAVVPPDAFINAGYDKYLINASRSWDKRRIKQKVKPANNPGGSGLYNERIQRLNAEESTLNTIVPSREDHTASVVVIPEPVTDPVKTSQTHVSTVNTIERKRTSIPRPAILKRTSATAPNSLIKPLNKRKDSAKANVKIIKPEGRGIASSTSDSTSKSKNQKPATLKEFQKPEISLMKIQEDSYEIKPSSTTKIAITNDRILSNNGVDIKNAIEDEAIMLVSHLKQNMVTYSNLNTNENFTGLDLQPIKIQHESAAQNANTILNEKDSHTFDKQLDLDFGFNDELKVSTEKNINETVLPIETSPIKHKYADNVVPKQTYDVFDVTNKVEIKSGVSKENEMNSQELDVKIEEPLHTRHSVVIKTQESSNFQCESIYTDAHLVSEDINIIDKSSSVDKSNFSKSYENIKINVFTSVIQSNSNNKSLDEQYVTVLNKGDVVNVKINIEIQNQGGQFVKTIDNAVNVQSTANIMQIENESQIDMNHQFFKENISLVPLIAKEVNEKPNVKESFILVQCRDYKYCMDQIVTVPEKPQNKSIVILMPANNVQEKVNGCKISCEYDQSQDHEPCKKSLCATESQRILGQSKCVSENIPISKNDNLTAVSSKEVKKPVVINGNPHSIDPSKCSDVNFKIDPVEPSSSVPFVNVMDNSTQTEWCDVLLEARLLGDGHYAFRFPTIEMLKLYNIR